MNKKAFTLIELLVVVLIIGILSAIALPQYQKAVYKARATEAMIMIKALANAQEVYYLANGEYTNDLSELDIEIPTNQIGGNLFTDKYSYACVQKRQCTASVNNVNMPQFESVMQNDSANSGKLAGKQFCNIYGYPTSKNDVAKSICQNMGVADTSLTSSWFVGNYYRLN